MKKLLFILVILAIAVSAVFAQNMVDPRLLTRIGMSVEEIEAILEIQIQSEKQIRVAKAEINILKSKLERLLLRERPNMQEVEDIIRETLEWRIENEVATVRARQQIKDMMGPVNWGELLKLRRRLSLNEPNGTPTRTRTELNEGTVQNNSTGNGTPNPAPGKQ